MDDSTLRTATQVIHGGQRPDPQTGAMIPTISTAATYAQESPGVHKGFEYSRSHNPTRYALERMVAVLEGSPISEEEDPSRGGFAFASGLAAMATVLELVDGGERILAGDDLYGGSRRLLTQVRERSQKLDVAYVDTSDLEAVAAAMTPETRMVWIETPTNPLLKIADLAAVCDVARAANPDVLVVCDNTFASPVFQKPLLAGCDAVLHSTTKYLNGHSDSVGGVVVVKDLALCQRLRFLQNAIGSVMSPYEAYQVLRGIKTLDVRMRRHAESGQRIAEYLEAHPQVEKVIYPGLPAHPHHALYRRQMSGFGGMITVYLRGGLDETRRFLESLEIFHLAESLGAVESLVNHPAIMTHASVPAAVRAELGIGDTMVRLSVGIEDVEDLIADLERGFAAARASSQREAEVARTS